MRDVISFPLCSHPVTHPFRIKFSRRATDAPTSQAYTPPFYANSMLGYGVDYNCPRPPFILAKLLWRYFYESPLGRLVAWVFTADDGGIGNSGGRTQGSTGKHHVTAPPGKWIQEVIVGVGADEYL